MDNKIISQLDSQHMLESIDQLAKQVEHAWQAVQKIEVPSTYRDCNKVVVFGMGGSALGADIAQSLFADQLSVPIIIHNDYTIPHWVDSSTLAIVSSYSGTTEETVEVTKHITDKTSNIMVITTGGPLQEFMEQGGYPGYIIEPTYNPCGQPRIAVGYATIGLLGLLQAVGMVSFTGQDVDDIVHFLDGNRELIRDEAIKVVAEMTGRLPYFIGSQFLAGNIHVVTNQVNENGKQLAVRNLIPELNHHLLEGMLHPVEVAKQVHPIFVESNLYHPRNQKRYHVTKQVLDKQGISYSTFLSTGRSELLQCFEVLQWGSYVSFYIAMANQVDPSPIPWVDFFKDALKKP